MQAIIVSMSMMMAFLFYPEVKPNSAFGSFAVLELFTSQGCSSCPPADALLSQTITSSEKDGINVYALSFHVDYWNRLGWSDPFSDKKYSDRQGSYAAVLNPGAVYTPQMIVNGSKVFVGSDKSILAASIGSALKTNAVAGFKKLEIDETPGNDLSVDFELEGSYPNCTVNFALVSLKETTAIKRGENEGRTLVNENVVRQLITMKTAASGKVEFAASAIPLSGKGKVIAFIQRTDDLKIIGAGAVSF